MESKGEKSFNIDFVPPGAQKTNQFSNGHVSLDLSTPH